jgi:tyrosyl-tRNA synthetase
MTKMKLSEELKWRGFVNQTTLPALTKLDEEKWIFYNGYDASSDSLTIGNLATVMLNKCFLRHGHKAIILAGGATSLIGDPGGKDSERILQSEESVRSNVRKVNDQLQQLFGQKVHFVNNLDWLKKMNVLDFLRDVGKHFSMTPLVQRDYIATRMGGGGTGISYTEFSYTLLQGYDFLHLYQNYGVELQLAGSDQWGNCLSGVDLVRRVENKEVHALTMPLIINKATGKKFGKTEDGAVWLDPSKTSAYQFYQFWLNVDDEGVEGYLKVFTELDKDKISQIMADFEKDKANRLAQKTLAYAVTKLVHGKDAADEAKSNAEALKLNVGDHVTVTDSVAMTLTKVLTKEEALSTPLADILPGTGLADSKTEARRLLESGGIYVNDKQVTKTHLEEVDFLAGLAKLRRGKKLKNTVIIKLK